MAIYTRDRAYHDVLVQLGQIDADEATPAADYATVRDRYQQVIEPLRRAVMIGIPVVLGLFAGLATAGRWSMVLEYFNRTPFGKKDPQFGLDIGFYVFELPFWRSVVGKITGGRYREQTLHGEVRQTFTTKHASAGG